MKVATATLFLAAIADAKNVIGTPIPTQTVVDLFLGAKRPGNYSFDGRIITADETATTYEIRCKSGALNLPGFPTTTCDLKDPVTRPFSRKELGENNFANYSLRLFQPWTVTNGPSTMIGVLSTGIETVTALLAETCTVKDRSAAYCNYTFIESKDGSSTTTSYATTITGDSYIEYPIAITAGFENLPTATASGSTPENTTTTTTVTNQPSSVTNGAAPVVSQIGFTKPIFLVAVIGVFVASW
ncbi:putative Ig-like domain-containing protein [Seiridium cardinale]|uniref:Ig-like domain-containing protein n=1 Tax=Seiridium cardinale TaxID=138064 RepID=A0ABR2XGB9_9PEZI